MALFDRLKKLQTADNNTSKSPSANNDGLGDATCTNIGVGEIPVSLAELQKMNISEFKDPFEVVALTVLALSVYPFQRDIAIDMLNYLKGPKALTQYEMQFLSDRFRGKDYLPFSYFVGATPENDYTPQNPSSINVYKTAHSEDMLSEGYLQLYLKSGGADTARPVRLRYKPSTKEWFLWEYFILADIRKPKSDSPWD